MPDRNSLILDIGCGTRLFGRLLKNEGYETIDGIDLTPEMFEKARALGVYRSLSEEDISEARKTGTNLLSLLIISR